MSSLMVIIIGTAIQVYHVDQVIDRAIQDRYWRGILFLPLRFLRVKLWDSRPVGETTFWLQHTTNSTTNGGGAAAAYFINMDADTERLATFQRINQKQMAHIQRVSATVIHPAILQDPDQIFRLVEPPKSNTPPTFSSDELETQLWYFQQYPNLRYLAQTEGFGTAACTLSHLRLLQHFSQDDSENEQQEEQQMEYIFVFEDDATLSQTLLNNGFVTGPTDADMLFLTQYSLGHVRVPWQRSNKTPQQSSLSQPSKHLRIETQPPTNANAIRVISGYNSVGYVVTQRGARIILRDMKKEKRLPIDLFFFADPNLKIYLPSSEWPAVGHNWASSSSSRRNADNQAVTITTTNKLLRR